MVQHETGRDQETAAETTKKKPDTKCRNLKEVKSQLVLEIEEKTPEKNKRQCQKYLLVYTDG